jgi:hypothetical protein
MKMMAKGGKRGIKSRDEERKLKNGVNLFSSTAHV